LLLFFSLHIGTQLLVCGRSGVELLALPRAAFQWVRPAGTHDRERRPGLPFSTNASVKRLTATDGRRISEGSRKVKRYFAPVFCAGCAGTTPASRSSGKALTLEMTDTPGPTGRQTPAQGFGCRPMPWGEKQQTDAA